MEFTDDFVKRHGFDGLTDFFDTIGSLDLSDPINRTAFKTWQYNDGTKAGLLSLNLPSCAKA